MQYNWGAHLTHDENEMQKEGEREKETKTQPKKKALKNLSLCWLRDKQQKLIWRHKHPKNSSFD